jgi:hypothetical protein
MSLSEELSRAVRAQAQGRCQYCLMHESLQGANFHIEHIMPMSKGGSSELENLTLACPGCNSCKAARITAIDPLTGQHTALYHPNRQTWSEHFRFDGYQVYGLSAVVRATVEALDLNYSRRQRIRAVEETFGLFPPVQS